MSTLKRTTRDRADSVVPVDGSARELVTAELTKGGDTFFPSGAQVGAARRIGDGALLLALYPKDFPANGEPSVVMEDLTVTRTNQLRGDRARLVGFGAGAQPVELRSLDAEGQTQIERLLAVLRADLVAQLTLRRLDQGAPGAKQSESRRRLAKTIARVAMTRSELLQSVAELPERLLSDAGETRTRFADLGVPRRTKRNRGRSPAQEKGRPWVRRRPPRDRDLDATSPAFHSDIN